MLFRSRRVGPPQFNLLLQITQDYLVPARLFAAHCHGLRISLFPRSNRQRFVVAHFVVHACAIRLYNSGCCAFPFVIPYAPVYPRRVIGRLGKAWAASQGKCDQCQPDYAHFHFKSPKKWVIDARSGRCSTTCRPRASVQATCRLGHSVAESGRNANSA